METFKFNEHGVCMNPIREGYKGKGTWIFIEVAKSSKGWVYGYGYDAPLNGAVSPCSIYKPFYATKEEARNAVIELVSKLYTRDCLNDDRYSEAQKRNFAKAYEFLKNMKSNIKQLELW